MKHNGCFTFQTIINITGEHSTFDTDCMDLLVNILFAKKLVYNSRDHSIHIDQKKVQVQAGVGHNIKPLKLLYPVLCNLLYSML